MSDSVEFIDPDPASWPVRAEPAGSGSGPGAITCGWAVAAALALVAPFLPFVVYPRWRGGPVTAAITLRPASLDGWTTQGEEPTVGIVLAICSALFVANALVEFTRHRSGPARKCGQFDRWWWAGMVASPAILLGVVAMLVLYLLTGTTRRAQITLPVARTLPVTHGQVAVPLPSSVRAPASAAGQQIVQVVRSAEILRSGCLWLTVAAAASALTALVIQINTAQDSRITSSPDP